ncbi:MAG: alpha/beta hydrolase [Salinibacterium sp.]|nr:alpha/beta hydrolase [Salinibacterium sp.]
MSTPTLHQIPVRGGTLTTAVWEPTTPATGTVLAIHGITASHLTWIAFAEQFPDVRIVAPDLRGRGGSRTLPGPWGMPQHGADVLAVLDALGVEHAVVVGHSMGAFVAVTLGAAHPERVSGLVLIDGGLPIPLAAGITDADLPDALIGPAAERLSMTFADAEAYREFWRKHPAFFGGFGEAIQRYVDYDLVETPDGLRPSSSLEAVTEDSLQLNDDTGYLGRMQSLRMPLHFIRAPRGLLDQPEALYPVGQVAHWVREIPGMVVHEVDDVNHYTIVMTAAGVRAVAPVVRGVLESTLVEHIPTAAKEHTS